MKAKSYLRSSNVILDGDLDDLRLAQEAADHAVTSGTNAKQANALEHWETFCDARGLQCTFEGMCREDILIALKLYLQQYRTCKLPHQQRTSKDIVRAATIAAELSAAGQALVNMDQANPFKDVTTGKWYACISRQLRGYARDDPPSQRAWPVTVAMLEHLCSMPPPGECPSYKWRAIQDLCIIAFFFLLRPGEFCLSGSEIGQPFRFQDITFHRPGARCLGHHLPSNDANITSTAVELCFVDQKSKHKGDRVMLHATGDDRICPVKAMERRIRDTLHVHPTESTRFHLWWSPTKGFQPIKLQDINEAIKVAASAVESETGIPPSLVSGASFRPGLYPSFSSSS